MTVGDKKLIFYYDQNGSVSSVLYNGEMYYYVKNLQGDITKLIDENGNVVANYVYDHKGAVISVKGYNGVPISDSNSIANINPFRYRGYVYDLDSGLYYLQSRYYDPTTGRFLNADVIMNIESVLGNNLFSYCENDYANKIDRFGYFTYRFGKSGYYSNEVYFFLILGDSDVRKIKLGITTAQTISNAIFGIVGAVLAYFSLGISLLVCELANVAIQVVLGLINAYIDYKNYGKGATVSIFMRYGTVRVYYPVFQRSKWGYWRSITRSYLVPYVYLSRVPKIAWRK